MRVLVDKIKMFLKVILVSVSMLFIVVQSAYAQNTTVSVPVPIMVPTLSYSPTPAITPQISQTPQQQGNGNTDIIGIAITAIGILIAKFHSDSKASNQNKESMAAILQNKQVQAELARVMYSLNPEKANTINDAPAVKLETLNNDVKDFADKAAKA